MAKALQLLGFVNLKNIANACNYLLSDASRWVTGSYLVVDVIKSSDVYDWLDKIRHHSIEQRFDKAVHFQDPTDRSSLVDLKKQIRQEVVDDIRGQRLKDRLRISFSILFGKKDNDKP
jgi:hypothetical protein